MKILTIILFLFNILFSSLYAHDERSFSLKFQTLNWDTNWEKHSIDYDELISGGPSKDGIPPIDSPKFETVQNAKTWLKDNEPLIFVNIQNKTKAYPLQVLIWHEIVNDSLANKKITVTFCPLCNASIVFNRVIKEKVYDFGTSGLLRNSDLVMYDRQTDSLWQQFTGAAIVGNMLDTKLEEINSSIVSFKDIYTSYPDTLILSKDTGHIRDYGRNPYTGYDDINQSPFMLKQDVDARLPPMRRVATIEINAKNKAYSYKILRNKKVINDSFENTDLTLFYKDKIASALDRSEISKSKDSGSVIIYDRKIKGKTYDFYYKDGFYFDKQTNTKWNIFGDAIKGKLKGEKLKALTHGSHFWFAWVVFKPDTLVYK
jgi:hypothetical protein